MSKVTSKKQKHVFVQGLRPLKRDPRDFKHSVVFGAAPVTVPNISFLVAPVEPILDQSNLDFCTGFATASINGSIQGQDFDPNYQFAKTKQVMGEYKTWGADLRSACKGLVKFGSLIASKSPYFYNPSDKNSKTRDFLANWTNWPESLDILAGEFKCGSFFEVDGPGDHFDNARAVLYKNREEKSGILFGVMWRPEWTFAPGGVIPEATYSKPAGEGHALRAYGQEIINGVPYIVVPNSWGKNRGNNGVYYFPRSVINKEIKTFGAFALKDMDAETAKRYIDYNLTTQDNLIAMIVKIVLVLAKDLSKILK